MEVIATSALTKVYGQKRAVDQLDMTVHEGDIYGFIGRNGSGKSTTLKTISGLLLEYVRGCIAEDMEQKE